MLHLVKRQYGLDIVISPKWIPLIITVSMSILLVFITNLVILNTLPLIEKMPPVDITDATSIALYVIVIPVIVLCMLLYVGCVWVLVRYWYDNGR